MIQRLYRVGWFCMRKQINETADGLLVLAPAKINLSLLIAGKRPDGFHEIETVMAKVDLYDEILFETTEKDGIELVCKGKYTVPHGKANLIYRACEMLYAKRGIRGGVRVTVTKNIPVGAGLGGGSSDAAAAIIGLNRFAQMGFSETEIQDLAGLLGSDVPFFLGGPLAFCSGRGEKIKKIEENFYFCALLVLPNVSVSTKRVYENYVHDCTLYKELKSKTNSLIMKKNIDSLGKMCANMLERSCFGLHSELADLKSRIESLGAGGVCLSGSGGAMYVLTAGADENDARRYQAMLKSIGCESVIVHNNRW